MSPEESIITSVLQTLIDSMKTHNRTEISISELEQAIARYPSTK